MPGHILVIDSTISNRVMLKSRLMAEYYQVSLAEDAQQGWQCLTEETPDIIFVNTRLSDGDGYSFASRIKLHPEYGHIPLILLAATQSDVDWKRAYSNFADDIQLLPINLPHFQPRLQSLLRSKATLDELRLRNRTPKRIGLHESAAQPFAGPAPKFKISVLGGEAAKLQETLDVLEAEFDIKATHYPAFEADLPDQTGSVLLVVKPARDQGEAYKMLSHLRTSERHRRKSILFVTEEDLEQTPMKAFELGANDAMSLTSPGALALRLKALTRQRAQEAALTDQLDNAFLMAAKDPLTGLYNRRYAMHYLRNALTKLEPKGRDTVLMMLDLDRFKSINDTYGHPAGDAVLAELGVRLLENIRPSDLVARMGGEEFMIVLNSTTLAQSAQIAERVRRLVSDKPFEAPGIAQPIRVTASIGMAFLRGHEGSDALMQRADAALYASKIGGRDKITVAKEAA